MWPRGKRLSKFDKTWNGVRDIVNVRYFKEAGYTACDVRCLLLRSLVRGPYPGYPQDIEELIERLEWGIINPHDALLPLNDMHAIARYNRKFRQVHV